MNAVLIFTFLMTCAGILFLAPTFAPGALAMCTLFSVPTIVFLARRSPERTFLLRLFLAGLTVRLIIGTVIFIGHYQPFFGGDANTYDIFGSSLVLSWHGDDYHTMQYERFISSGAGAWGMLYLVAGVYEVIGDNMLAIQFINATVGAATAAVIYYVAQHLFNIGRVSRWAALLTAFFPSLILWSSQGLKDGLIVMALTLSILATLRLMQKITARYMLVLTGCLMVLLSMRFYIFYMMVASAVGAFVLGARALNTQAMVQRFIAIIAIGLALMWFGVLRYAGTQFERYGNLDAVHRSRMDMARSAESGFGRDVDIRTTEGAITAIPLGLVYLLFAPFPWQLASMRQSLALPETIIWWLIFPLLILGLWYAIKHRLREVSPILLFTTMLTLAYSVFQGNVGTAYRQRSQLLVFYFIFIAVGGVLLKERSENRRQSQIRAKQELAELQAARILARRQSFGSTGSS